MEQVKGLNEGDRVRVIPNKENYSKPFVGKTGTIRVARKEYALVTFDDPDLQRENSCDWYFYWNMLEKVALTIDEDGNLV